MEILGDGDEADGAAWSAAGAPTPVRVPGVAGYSRDATLDRTGIPLRGASPAPPAPELDLGEQAPDQERAGYETRQAEARHAEPDWPADPRPGLQHPLPPAVAPVPDAEPDPPVTLWDKLTGVVLSAEALGLTGVLIALGAASSTIPTVLAFTAADGTAAQQMSIFAYTYGLAGLLVLALGLLAVSRLSPGLGTPAGRALAGAAVLLGVLLVAVAAYLTVLAGDLPRPTVDDGGSVG